MTAALCTASHSSRLRVWGGFYTCGVGALLAAHNRGGLRLGLIRDAPAAVLQSVACGVAVCQQDGRGASCDVCVYMAIEQGVACWGVLLGSKWWEVVARQQPQCACVLQVAPCRQRCDVFLPPFIDRNRGNCHERVLSLSCPRRDDKSVQQTVNTTAALVDSM